MIVDIAIGFIIGLFAERFLKLTIKTQTAIEKAKAAKRAEAARKKALIKPEE